MIRFLVVRHGETQWNAASRIQGQLDIPLNARGHEQAAATSNRFAGEQIDQLWSSDLNRAHETAQHIARISKRGITLDARLRERHFGILQGLTYEEAERRYPEHYSNFRASHPAEAFGNGESLRAFYARVAGFFSERACAAQAGSTIAVVAHGGVVSQLYRHAKQIPLGAPRTWPLPNAAINEFCFAQGQWRVERFADVSHLSQALDDA
jgi:2,3-bisphosphoglycerate-dependent phosphoglycerate mutase